MSKEIWGYARVSTKEQSLERQLVELCGLLFLKRKT